MWVLLQDSESTEVLVILKDDETFVKLRAEKFDLGITEHFESCGYGILKKIGLQNYITT